MASWKLKKRAVISTYTQSRQTVALKTFTQSGGTPKLNIWDHRLRMKSEYSYPFWLSIPEEIDVRYLEIIVVTI